MTEEFKQFEIKETYTVEGITEDYVWYHAKLLANKMASWSLDFQKLVDVMESRHREHLNMIEDLIRQKTNLEIDLKMRDRKNENPDQSS